jgi:PAS domain S-box-containing protein
LFRLVRMELREGSLKSRSPLQESFLLYERRDAWLWFAAAIIQLSLAAGMVLLVVVTFVARRDSAYGVLVEIAACGLAALALGFNLHALHRRGPLKRKIWKTIKESEMSATLAVQVNQRYRDLVENAIYGIYHEGIDGKLLDANHALVEILGYGSKEELFALDVAKDIYLYASERSRMIEQYRSIGRVRGVEVVWKKKGGKAITVLLSGRALLDEQNQLIGYEVIVEDVTNQRRLERQLRLSQRMEAVGQLAGGIAHEFNNMLAIIIGYSDVLAEALDPADALSGNLEQIKKAADRAATLTRQLLAFSRQQVLQSKVIDLNFSVTEMAKMLRRLLGETIDLTVVTHPALGRVKADGGQIEQVIMNLATNARDAMPRGGKLTIKTANAELTEPYTREHVTMPPGQYVLLSVADTGVGMDAESVTHIFDPFFTTKEKRKGAGLGLATVYGFVKQSGGFIWVDSEVGKGSMFRIYLPRVEDEIPVAQPVSSKQTSERSETILLVEDEHALRKVTREHLLREGYTVLEAENGDEALLRVKSYPGPLHLLMTDVVLPGISGRVLAESLKTLRPETKVLFVSGYSHHEIEKCGVMQQDIPLLAKPYNRESLARKIREILDSPQSN